MTTLNDLVRDYGRLYEAKHGAHLLPSHRRTLRDMAYCQTAALGGHVYYCATCDRSHYQYHSCQNRHCPQCQHQQGQVWLEAQQAMRLPVPYFMVTFTLPEGLRSLARQHQRAIYNLLFRTSAEALQQLAWNSRYIGGQIGCIGVLHTWGRNLSYHPHVHYLVPLGGLSAHRDRWCSPRHTFLVPVKALSVLFRAKFREGLKKLALFDHVPADVWQQSWVTHAKSVGKGEGALKYLAPYIFRVAISNQRIVSSADGQVTFRYRDSQTGRWQTSTVSVEEFLRRFLQHVLPKGFVKVRYYGLFSHSLRHWLPVIRLWLQHAASPETRKDTLLEASPTHAAPRQVCRKCGHPMQWVRKIFPCIASPPRRTQQNAWPAIDDFEDKRLIKA